MVDLAEADSSQRLILAVILAVIAQKTLPTILVKTQELLLRLSFTKLLLTVEFSPTFEAEAQAEGRD